MKKRAIIGVPALAVLVFILVLVAKKGHRRAAPRRSRVEGGFVISFGRICRTKIG
jgi:hypothetical protein